MEIWRDLTYFLEGHARAWLGGRGRGCDFRRISSSGVQALQEGKDLLKVHEGIILTWCLAVNSALTVCAHCGSIYRIYMHERRIVSSTATQCSPARTSLQAHAPVPQAEGSSTSSRARAMTTAFGRPLCRPLLYNNVTTVYNNTGGIRR